MKTKTKAKAKTKKASEVQGADEERVAASQREAIRKWAGTILGQGFSGRDHDEVLAHEERYLKARESALRRLKKGLPMGGGEMVSREELNERGGRH
mgnify:CR=1 FL=1